MSIFFEISSETSLSDFIQKQFELKPSNIAQLRGFSNRNYSFTDELGLQYVLRIARANRLPASVQAEEYVLSELRKRGIVQIPKLIRPHAVMQKTKPHFIHLFEKLPGNIDCFWWEQCSIPKLKQIFISLAKLHHAMGTIPPLWPSTVLGFNYPLPDIAPSILDQTPVGKYVLQKWKHFLQKVLLLQRDVAHSFPWEHARFQWVHGDIQLENVLFKDGKLTSILDFEFVRWDACEKDAIFSAFRVCKEGICDSSFQYDQKRFALSLETYLEKSKEINAKFFRCYDRLWKPYFCLDQAFIYLVNAFDGVWKLEERTGFLPCFNEVLNYHSV